MSATLRWPPLSVCPPPPRIHLSPVTLDMSPSERTAPLTDFFLNNKIGGYL